MLQHLVISDASAILKVIHSVPKWIVGETAVTGELGWIVGETQQYNISDGSTFRKGVSLCA